jgi:hypothetical protein
VDGQRAGAQVVWVGAESGPQAIADAMEKGTPGEQITRLHTCLGCGVQVGFPAIRLPGETRKDIEKTLNMVQSCQPDDIGMSVAYPYRAQISTLLFENSSTTAKLV